MQSTISKISDKSKAHDDTGQTPERSALTASRYRANHSLPVGLTIMCHAIHPDHSFVPCEPKQALSLDQSKGLSYWIDLKMDNTAAEVNQEDLKEWLADNLDLPHFITRRLVGQPMSNWHSGLITASQSAKLLFLRVLPAREGNKVQFEAAMLLENLLVTFTRGSTELFAYMKEPECLVDASSRGSLLAWLMFHVEKTSRTISFLRSRTLTLDKAVEEDPMSVKLEDIHELKSSIMQICAIADEQSETVKALNSAEKDELKKKDELRVMKGTAAMLLSIAKSNERFADRLEQRVLALRQSYDSFQQGRLNNRLALLTMLSAIFLPLSLAAGIYGMNFENMPELTWYYSYYVFLIGIASVAAILLLCFYRAGWYNFDL